MRGVNVNMFYDDLNTEEQVSYLIKPILQVLQEAGGQLERSEIRDRISELDEHIAEFEQKLYTSNKTGNQYKKFDFKFNFAIKELSYVGLISYVKFNPKITLTQDGANVDLTDFDVKTEVRDKARSYWEEHSTKNKSKNKPVETLEVEDEENESTDDELLDDSLLEDEDDYEDDFLDEDDDMEEKPKKKFFEKFSKKKNDEEEDFLDDEPEDETVKAPVAKSSAKTAAAKAPARQERISRPAPSSKITPMRTSKRSSQAANMEVCVIKPTTMEEAREIADTLVDNSTVILNLEGIDVELAQRIIDFTSGACYSLGGSLQQVSSYIFVLGPYNVDITGDLQNILGGSVPSVRVGY